MRATLLLDLDHTLLDNDIETFLPSYLKAFAETVALIVDPDRFVATLLSSTRAMVGNRRPDCRLKEVFDEAFFPAMGLQADEFQVVADEFYARVFPALQSLTQPRPEAVQLVEQAVDRGYRIAIATNPLFPLTAIEQRLAWANLPVDRYRFELVTSYETFHFVKPEPAYFAEVLARLGWPEGPVVTVGDDLERDIIASNRLGLKTFWVTQDGKAAQDTPESPTASGAISEVWPWLQSAPDGYLDPDFNSPAAMLAILRATPAVLDSLSHDMPADISAQRPQPDEWCLKEIVCHLRDVDQEVHLWRIQKVLTESNPFLPGESTDPWAEERRYIQQDGAKALHQFIACRVKLLDLLESIPSKDWERPSRHAIFGPTFLRELVGIIAAHDRLHIRQVHRVFKDLGIY